MLTREEITKVFLNQTDRYIPDTGDFQFDHG